MLAFIPHPLRQVLFFLLFSPALYAQATEEEMRQQFREAQSMYSMARTMLEEKSVTDVSGIPSLLQRAADLGSIHAELLLIDVWEGRFKGLENQEEAAFELVQTITQRPLPKEKILRPIQRKKERAEAMYRFALYHEKGMACPVNPKEAFAWMSQATLGNHFAARVELARYYMQGVGTPQDAIMALRLLKEQSELDPNVPNLYFYLGYMCEHGIGFRSPQALWAVTYYSQGAEQGDARAANNLASMYERGAGVSQDNSAAMRLYRLAAALGDKNASVNMQRLSFEIGEQEAPPEPWPLRVNRGLLSLVRVLPLQWGLLPYLEEKNQRLELQYKQLIEMQ